jgi:hypothetical protein
MARNGSGRATPYLSTRTYRYGAQEKLPKTAHVIWWLIGVNNTDPTAPTFCRTFFSSRPLSSRLANWQTNETQPSVIICMGFGGVVTTIPRTLDEKTFVLIDSCY